MAFPQRGLAAVRWDAACHRPGRSYEDPSHLPEELGDTPMSAAETAGPTPPHMNIPRDAAVIDISTRASRQAIRGRGQRMTPTPHHHDSGDTPDAVRLLAEHFETTFNQHRLTLSDRRTAEAYTLTLRLVDTLLDGAHSQGVIGDGQRDELHQMIEGMRAAPGLITG